MNFKNIVNALNRVTDAIKNISGVSGGETDVTIGAIIGGADDATPNNNDFIATSLTAGGVLKKLTWTNAKAFLTTYFDTLYPSGSGTSTGTNTGDQTNISGNAATVTTNADLVGVVTSSGNATSIANKALALAKLADGVAGEVPVYNSSGVISTAGAGTSGQVFTSNGPSSVPTFQDSVGGGGGGEPNFISARQDGYAAGIYTDDILNIAFYRGTAPLRVGLVSGDISTAGMKFFGTTLQFIAITSIWATATTVGGAITLDGFIYALIGDGSTQRVYRADVTTDVSSSGNWTQLTISGTAIGTGESLIGYGNSNFWIADPSTEFRPYSLSGTTLTSGTAVNVTGSSYIINSRVNDNGIYASFSSTPYMRKANFSGTISNGFFNNTFNSAGFTMPSSFYGKTKDAGSSINGLSKFD